MASPLVRATFALIVAATIAAFFVTQQLKGGIPARIALRRLALPVADRRRRQGRGARGFDLSEPAKVTFSVVDSEGQEVRTLVDDRQLKGDVKHRYYWNGRDDDGKRVPDGTYHLRVIRRDEGRVINSIKTIRVDTERPRVRIVSARQA